MLTKHKSFFNSLLKTTIFPLIFIIFTSFLSFSLSADTKCAEQWKEIELVPENWTSVGHANVTLKNDTGVSFEFENTDSSSGGDVVGAVWHEMDFSQKKGLHISFRPQITSDPSYGGSVKYPQGFAIVFTSSSIENLVGEKGSGIIIPFKNNNIKILQNIRDQREEYRIQNIEEKQIKNIELNTFLFEKFM